MNFPKMKLTDVGRQVLTKVLAGASVKFTHFVLGNAACPNPDDWVGLTAPISPVMTCDITGIDIVSDCVVLRGEFSNANAPESFMWYEQCVYGSVIDDEEYSNVMIYYGNAIDHPEYVPGPDSPTAFTYRWSTPIKVSSSASVSATVQSITYATLAQLSEHTNNQQNPHNVTKEQIGLGNVENVAPDRMVINFSNIGSLRELIKGEPLASVLSKLAAAITVLHGHLENKENPHAVTANQAGAAEKSHRSTGTEHGMATDQYFGHVKLVDTHDGKETAGNGMAVTPKALSIVHEALSAYNGSYIGTGTVFTGSNLTRYGTPVYVRCAGIPKFILILGKGNAQKHSAFLRIDGSDASGLAFVDGEVIPLAVSIDGNFMDGITNMTYRVSAINTAGATAAKQMNMNGEVYNYTAIF